MKMAMAVREVIDCSRTLASDCEEIAAISARQRSDVDRQQHELTQVASAMEEMTASSQEVARHTSSASEQVQESNRRVDAGTTALDAVAARIRSLADNVDHSATVIARVQQECLSIGSVLEVIRGIADQTNLLALNAAIEAARAGEQGRGFAVVADEVRTLATRTQESTTEIQKTIEQLQRGATEAVEVMGGSRGSASDGVQELQGAATTLHTINGLIDSLTKMNLQIATAAEEQSSVAGEVNRSISAINALSNEAAAGAARVDQAVRDLNALAEKLRGLTATFRVA